MTAVDNDPAPASPRPDAYDHGGAWWRRAWRAPVRAHLAVLGVILVALIPVIGTGSSFSADEGAAIIQARSLSDGRGWIVEHPAPELDPTGRHYPLELSETGRDGTAPFAKHPLYALLLAAADGVGGTAAMVLLSLAGSLAAAGLAAALAARLGGAALARPALWIVGLASPLLLDGYLVIAHTLAAAAAAAAVLSALDAIERRSTLLAATAVPACVAVAVLLRNEAVFFGLGLGIGAAVLALRPQGRSRRPAVAAALGSVGAAGVAHLAEGMWTSHLVGGRLAAATASAAAGGPPTNGFVRDRIDGFLVTWLTPTYSGRPIVGLALLVMVGAVGYGAWCVRRRPERPGPISMASTVAAAAGVIAAVTGPTNVVPGLLLAFPFVAAGLVLLSRDDVHDPGPRLAAVAVGVFTVAVIATQYSTGGSGEWGGRYFALALPVAVPILLLGIDRHRHALQPALARRAGAALAVCSFALAVIAVGSIASAHRFTGDLVDSVAQAAGTGPEGALIVTTAPSMPRLAWSTFDRQRWLLTSRADLGDLARRLPRFTFVTRDLPADLPALDGLAVERRSGPADGSGWQILTVNGG